MCSVDDEAIRALAESYDERPRCLLFRESRVKDHCLMCGATEAEHICDCQSPAPRRAKTGTGGVVLEVRRVRVDDAGLTVVHCTVLVSCAYAG